MRITGLIDRDEAEIQGGGSVLRREHDGCLAVVDGRGYEPRGASGDLASWLIRTYRHQGIDRTLAALNGDFAFALWDATERTLHLARDRFGVKPLYYALDGGRLAFASRPAALLELPWISAEPDKGFLARFAGCHYRSFDYDPRASAYANISQLPAAHLLTWRSRRLTERSYWSITEAPELDATDAELAERYRALLLDAVSIRMRDARCPAFTLSGGMDSSSVLSCAVHETGRTQVAYSVVYRDPTYDESQDIEAIVEPCLSAWHRVELGDELDLDLVAEMIRAHDEPVATATWLSHYVLCREAAARGTGTLFGGLGGDELNAGEFEHFWYHFADLRAAGDEDRLADEVRRWVQHHDHPIHRKSREILERHLPRLVDPARPGHCRPDERRLWRYRHALAPEFAYHADFEPDLEHPFQSFLANRTWQDLTRETIPCCLRAEDRNGAAFGLVQAQPFLDHRLAEFMFRVPGHLKIRGGVTKVLLREAMRGILPEATRTRITKMGWNAPAHVWFSGARLEPLLDLVHSRSFRERGIYDQGRVHALIDEHREIVDSGQPRENHMMFLWQLVNLELWLRVLDRLTPRPRSHTASRGAAVSR